MRSKTTTQPAEPTPLGPESLTWKYFGDLRTGMLGVWIGSLQNMYPQLGAGVEDHSILLREPLQRVARSVYPIMGVVYDGERARRTGEQIKSFHATIKGVDSAGPALPRTGSRDVLLGARHVLHARPESRRVLLRRADRGRETPAVRRTRAVVPDVRHEHAAGPGGPTAGSPPTRRWSRRRASRHLPEIAADCRCTMSPDTRASSRAPGLWCTRRSHSPDGGPPEDVPPPPEPEIP